VRNLKDIEIVLVAFLATLTAYAFVGGDTLSQVLAGLAGALAMAARGRSSGDT
jgi:hypothetical protein